MSNTLTTRRSSSSYLLTRKSPVPIWGARESPVPTSLDVQRRWGHGCGRLVAWSFQHSHQQSSRCFHASWAYFQLQLHPLLARRWSCTAPVHSSTPQPHPHQRSTSEKSHKFIRWRPISIFNTFIAYTQSGAKPNTGTIGRVMETMLLRKGVRHGRWQTSLLTPLTRRFKASKMFIMSERCATISASGFYLGDKQLMSCALWKWHCRSH